MSSRYSRASRSVAVLAGAVAIFAACSCYGGERTGGENNSLRAWAEAALLGKSAGPQTAAGATFSAEFPVTFNLITRKIDETKLPFLEMCQQDHGKLMLGKSVMNTPLRLGDKSYEHGLGTHSVSAIRVLLNKPASRFTADIGVNADTKVGTVAFVVEVGGKAVYRSGTCKGGEAAIPVSVDLNGVKEFILRVFDANNDASCDWADWCDAKVTYTDDTTQWLDRLPVYPSSSAASCIKTPSSKLLPKWTRTEAVGTSDDAAELRTVSYTDPDTGLKVSTEIKVFKDYSAVEWVTRFTNTGSKDTPMIGDIRGIDTRLDVPDDTATLHYAQGSRCNGLVDAKAKTGYDFQP
ncbi:MAG: NPCBM/NEW2 domain-containing protein, partial [Planctomycetaceae bacterium]|nr:NPCBM/NEW2 domain-containing protein [Planctomycetaceae bacterium]